MAMLHQILGLASILFILESSLFLSGRASPPESPLKRQTREVGAPHPIDCELTAWGNWSKCEPCTSLRYRSRDIVKMGQFGGKRCLAPVGDSQRCKPDKPCEIENDECKPGEFKCDSGRCIKNRLVCNADNDCGDNSDELCDDQDPKPTCRTHDLELSEIGRTAGNGVNILGLGTRSNPFDNEYFNGICDRVRDGNKAMYFRKPWNAATLVYQTRADRSFTTETFENSMDLISKHIEETTNTFGGSLTLKVTPTEHNDTTIGGTLELNNKKSKRLEKIKEYSTQENKMFIKLSGTVELGTFHLRGRGAMLTNTFIEDMTSLPTVYDKGEYFQFLETYGTHYSLSGTMGGKYELVYIVDTQKMKLKEVTSEDVSDCLGFSLSLSLTKKEIEAEAKIKNEKCSKIIDNDDGTQQKNDVIDKVISFVEGGTVEYATELDEKLSKRVKEVDTEDFVKWATSLTESPVLIKQKPSPIYTLIPVDAKDAHEKKQNLERAIEDYLNENSVCKCQPCQNGGTVMLVDGECLCQCTIYFKGIACQIKKSTMYENPPVVVDGRWGCWSPASSCVNEEQTLQRQCNNPAPGQGGKPCPGENIKKVPC